jgi:hypothetical protein
VLDFPGVLNLIWHPGDYQISLPGLLAKSKLGKAFGLYLFVLLSSSFEDGVFDIHFMVF